MANSKQTLVQRIALDGGKAIEDELKQIGDVGEAAFAKLKEFADKLAASQTGVNRFLSGVKEDFTAIAAGSAKVRSGFDSINQGFGGLIRNFQALGIALAGIGGAGLGFEKIAESASEAADSQGKAAASAGVAIKDYGRLQFAFEQGDVAADQFNASMKAFNKVLSDAAAGGSKNAALFKQLGVNIKGSNGQLRPTSAIVEDLADAFAKLPNGANKSALALALFGKNGAALIPTLNDGAAAMKALGDQAEQTGTVFTEQQAAIGDAFGDSLNLLKKNLTGLKDQVGITLAPAFTEAFDTITKLINDNRANILAFADSIVKQVIPVIKDVANAFAGNDAEVANKNILALRDTFVKVGSAISVIIDVLGTVFTIIENAIQPLVDLYNNTLGNIFGKIDAQTAIIIVAITALTGVFRTAGLIIKGTTLIIEGLAEIFGTVTAQIVGVGVRVLLVQGLLKTLVDDMTKSFTGLGSTIQSVFQAALDAVAGFFKDLGSTVTGIFDTITKAINAVIDLAKKAIAAAQSALGGGGGGDSGSGGDGFARGGFVRGAGTGTSDSIFARLSNGEFVIRAAAVRKLGVGFLNSLNNVRGNMAFADGGLVGALRPSFSVPGFADGGLVGSSDKVPFNLTIDGQSFTDLLAPADVAAKMVDFATGRKLRSGGSKPSWKK